MGLDIYLDPAAEHEQRQRHWAAWDALWQRKERGEIDEGEWERLCAELPPDSASRFDDPVKSERYPDHYFGRRYLRSSYNGSGFNRAVPDFLGTGDRDDEGSLYWIFQPMGREWDGDEATLTTEDVPKLRECKARALEVAERLRTSDTLRVEAPHGPILGTASHTWSSLPRQGDVLAWYREERERNAEQYKDKDSGGYSSAKGTVFGFDKGLEVLAVTMCRDVLGSPSPAIVFRQDVTFYVEAAEITAEFCDEAIGLIERDGRAYLSWSG